MKELFSQLNSADSVIQKLNYMMRLKSISSLDVSDQASSNDVKELKWINTHQRTSETFDKTPLMLT